MSNNFYDSCCVRFLDLKLGSNFPKDLKNKLLSVINSMAYCNNDFDKNFLDGIADAVSSSNNFEVLPHFFVKNFEEKDLLKLKTMLYKYYNNFSIDSNVFYIDTILKSFVSYILKDPNITIFKSVSDNLDIRKLFFLFQGVSEGKFQDLGYIDNLDDEKFYDVVSKYLNNINLDMLKYVLENDRTLSQFYFFVILDKLGLDLDMEYVKNVIEEVGELYNLYNEKYRVFGFSYGYYNNYSFSLYENYLFFYYRELSYINNNLFFSNYVKKRFRLFLMLLFKLIDDFRIRMVDGHFLEEYWHFFSKFDCDMMHYKYSICKNLEKFSKFIGLYIFFIKNFSILTRSIDSDEDRKLFLDYIFNDLFFDLKKLSIMIGAIEWINGSLYDIFEDVSLSKISRFFSVFDLYFKSFLEYVGKKYNKITFGHYMYADRRVLISCLVSDFVDYMLSDYSKKRTLKFNFNLFKKIFAYVIEKNIRCDYSLLFRNGKKSITMLRFYNSLN